MSNQVEIEVPVGGNVMVFTEIVSAVAQENGTIQVTLDATVLPAGTILYVKEKHDG